MGYGMQVIDMQFHAEWLSNGCLGYNFNSEPDRVLYESSWKRMVARARQVVLCTCVLFLEGA